jgi:hypothetical protein
MKTLLYLSIACIILFLSCNKEVLTYPSSILAGQKTGDGVFYKDLVPDDSIGDGLDSETRFIDLDEDGVADFKLYSGHTQASGFGSGGSWITPLDSNEVACQPNTIYIDTLSANEVINSSLYWVKKESIYYYYYYSQVSGEFDNDAEGLWNTVSHKYAGLRIKKDNEYLYGWLRVDMNIHFSQILMEYGVTKAY